MTSEKTLPKPSVSLKSFVFAFLLFTCSQSWALTPFVPEEGVSYFSRQSYGLYKSNLLTGVNSLVYRTNQTLEAVAYNPVDNFIYAMNYGTNYIFKIGSDGEVEIFQLEGLNQVYRTPGGGDIDMHGNYYLYNYFHYIDDGFLKVDLNTRSYSFIYMDRKSSDNHPTITDFVLSPDGTLAYGIDDRGDLRVLQINGPNVKTYRFSPTNLPDGAYNIYTDNSGNLFVQLSETGDTYFIRTDQEPGDEYNVDAAMVGRGSFSLGRSDGTRPKSISFFPTAVQPNFFCQNDVGFVLQSSGGYCNAVGNEKIYKYNVKTNEYTLQKEGLLGQLEDGTINGLAFNPKDGYLWAYRRGTNEPLRIGSDWSVRYFYIHELIPRKPGDWYSNPNYLNCLYDFKAGDIDKNGIMYLVNSGNELRRADLNPSSGNYLSVGLHDELGAMPDGSSISDFAFNPVDGFPYSITTSMHLVKINIDAETVTDLGKIAIENPQNVEAMFFNAAGDLLFQGTNDDKVYAVRKVQLGNLVATLEGNSGQSITLGDAASCPSSTLRVVTVRGRVWDDADANTTGSTEPNTATDDPNQTLTVYLTDDVDMVIAKANVAASGVWRMTEVPENGTYKFTLSNDRTIPLGKIQPSFPSVLPSGRVPTGINFPTAIIGFVWYGTIDVTNASMTHVDFGIQKKPVADNKSYILISQPVVGESIILNGNRGGISPPAALTGSDYEDGIYDGNPNDGGPVTRVIITSLPVPLNGAASGGGPELYYQGRLVTVGTPITYYSQNDLLVKLNGSGYKGFQFTYQMMDIASAGSDVATYKVTWQSPLPVKLISFGLTKEGETAKIAWTTSEEENADRFEVERSPDAKNWITIKSVKAAGNSSSKVNYSAGDPTPLPGASYYRLKMIDLDGSYTYSRAASFQMNGSENLVLPYPNPAASRLFFTGNPEIIKSVSVLNSREQTVVENAQYVNGLDVSKIPDGPYLMIIHQTDGQTITHKIFISN